jgi:hypothetical protein
MLKSKIFTNPSVVDGMRQDDHIHSSRGDRIEIPTAIPFTHSVEVHENQDDDFCPSRSGKFGGLVNGTGENSTRDLNAANNTPVLNQLHLSAPSLVALARRNSFNVNEKATRRKSFNFKDTGDLAFDKLIRSYETAVHYTKQDLKKMGRDIVRGIFQFANLTVPLIPTPPSNVKSPKSPLSKSPSNAKLRTSLKEQATHVPPVTDTSRQSSGHSNESDMTGTDHSELIADQLQKISIRKSSSSR